MKCFVLLALFSFNLHAAPPSKNLPEEVYSDESGYRKCEEKKAEKPKTENSVCWCEKSMVVSKTTKRMIPSYNWQCFGVTTDLVLNDKSSKQWAYSKTPGILCRVSNAQILNFELKEMRDEEDGDLSPECKKAKGMLAGQACGANLKTCIIDVYCNRTDENNYSFTSRSFKASCKAVQKGSDWTCPDIKTCFDDTSVEMHSERIKNLRDP